MKTVILWILGMCTLFLAGLVLYKMRRNSNPAMNESGGITPNEDLAAKGISSEMSPEEVAEAERQQLLAQLCELRKEAVLRQYRQSCAALFEGLCGGIQGFLAQEKQPLGEDFCIMVETIAENESVSYRIRRKKTLQFPEPISPEIADADVKTLRQIIYREKQQIFIPVVDIPWESLLDSLIPILNEIIRAAKEDRAEDCQQLLPRMRELLETYRIYALWYQDEIIQNNPAMRWNFVEDESDPEPTLFYQGNDQYICIGVPGCTGRNHIEKQE